MKTKTLSIGLALLALIILPSYKQVTNTVSIGGKVWTSENLNVSKFRNGDLIPQAKTAAEWKTAATNKKPAWCYLNNDPRSEIKYGKLYNWYAVTDTRGLAPAGWHIPSLNEAQGMINSLGGNGTAGKKMRATSGWETRTGNANGTNESGFNGYPGASRDQFGDFTVEGSGKWWTSTPYTSPIYSWYFAVYNFDDKAVVFQTSKAEGLSVRCIKD